MEKIKIHLEDNGQDLLWLVCGEDGRIVDAGPFQSSVWVGEDGRIVDAGPFQSSVWVGEDGRIVDTGPFQSSVWVGGLIPVWDDEMLKVGEPCPIHAGFIKYGYLKHKIEKIETIEN